MPSIDALLNFPDFAPYLFLPGWQQPSTSLELLVLERTWLALSESDRQIVMRGCEESLGWTLEVAVSRQEATIAEFRAQGVQILTWPDEVLDALKLSWEEVIEEEIAETPDVGFAWQSYLRFDRQADAATEPLGEN
jgi:TRAP-type mannitol/chloroaromatic compound transport system substrate-binding protein